MRQTTGETARIAREVHDRATKRLIDNYVRARYEFALNPEGTDGHQTRWQAYRDAEAILSRAMAPNTFYVHLGCRWAVDADGAIWCTKLDDGRPKPRKSSTSRRRGA